MALATADGCAAAAIVAAALSCLGIIVGGAYHSHFTYLGRVGKLGDEAALSIIAKNNNKPRQPAQLMG